jgi:hypothetical protein
VYRQSISLKPGDVALVLEPAAYTPALYKGRSLVPENGSVRVVAIADLRTSPTNRLDPDTLSYSWTVGDVTNANASGIGKSSIVLPAPLTYRSQDVSVVVQSRDGTLVGSDSVRISSVRPTLRLYITDPLQGPLYDNAISGSHTLQGSETTFTAVPYSFSLTQGVPVIRWFLNGASVREGASITLRSEGAGRGRASLSASSGSGSDTITAGLSLIFGENSSGFFGL